MRQTKQVPALLGSILWVGTIATIMIVLAAIHFSQKKQHSLQPASTTQPALVVK
jgi:hypothetical protein